MKRIHLIGICGTAMATLAAMLKARGHDVRGSDQNVYPPMSDFLAEQQIVTLHGYDAEHISADLDLVSWATPSRGQPRARGGAGPKDPGLFAARSGARPLPVGSRSIVIAGTHGKTTTTSLAGWVLTYGGADPACSSAESPRILRGASVSAADGNS